LRFIQLDKEPSEATAERAAFRRAELIEKFLRERLFCLPHKLPGGTMLIEPLQAATLLIIICTANGGTKITQRKKFLRQEESGNLHKTPIPGGTMHNFCRTQH
jgi:hypothetical protein